MFRVAAWRVTNRKAHMYYIPKYQEKLATYLKVESGYEYNYIMTNDDEQALKDSKEKFFPDGIHFQCEEPG